jgi:hypothetical protein
MHRSFIIPALLSLLSIRRSNAFAAAQADAAPCLTTILLPDATLTASPGPSNVAIYGLFNGATSTIKVNGPAITIGPNTLSLNNELNLVLDGTQYELGDICPATLVPGTSKGPSIIPRDDFLSDSDWLSDSDSDSDDDDDKAPACSLKDNGVAAGYPFKIGDDGPLPELL